MGWFHTREVDEGVTLIWEPHVRLGIRCNVWHVRGTDRDVLIDSGMGVVALRDELGDLLKAKTLCVATHTHFDHIGGHHEFSERAVHPTEARILAAPTSENTAITQYVDSTTFLAAPCPDFDWRRYEVQPAAASMLLVEGDLIDLGDRQFRVLHLPGHSPGSIALLDEANGTLFSGDAIYDGTLYDRIEGSSITDYRRSLKRLRSVPVRVVHGGHRDSFDDRRMVALIDAYLAQTADAEAASDDAE